MRQSVLAFYLAVLCIWAASAAAKKAEAPPALKVVSRFAVPLRAGGMVVDLRWASQDSVYVADLRAGVTEVRLAPGLPEVRRVTPSSVQIGLPLIQHMAISPKWMLAAHVGRLAWRAKEPGGLGAGWQVGRHLGFFHGFDVRGDEVVMLGFPDMETYGRSRGGVLWQANLAKGLDLWEPLFESKEVAQDFEAIRRLEVALGSIRFLPQGGFVAAPNFIPGVLLFSSAGKLLRHWSSEELWGAEKAWKPERVEAKDLLEFLATRRTIEEVLPLPEGPAIVVREPLLGQEARYRLGVLAPEIRWYDIPKPAISPAARLRGDVDEAGRIVLVGVPRALHESVLVRSNEILVLRLPR